LFHHETTSTVQHLFEIDKYPGGLSLYSCNEYVQRIVYKDLGTSDRFLNESFLAFLCMLSDTEEFIRFILLV